MEDQLKGIENLRELTRGKVNNEIDIIKVEVEAQYKELIRSNEAHIVEVEALLAAARKYEITRDVYARVAEWAVAKKAPFIGDKKNSAADAAILFGAVDFVQENRWSGDFLLGDSLFVSANKGDFSSKTNPDKIHEDLAPMLEAVSMGYARSLPAALAKVDETVFRENEIREMEADMDDYLGEVECSACEANEYNRYDNYVILADVEITGVKEEGNDEDQLELEFKDMQNEDKKAMRIRVGWCPSCGTMR